jgi:uncharacterized membrane protein
VRGVERSVPRSVLAGARPAYFEYDVTDVLCIAICVATAVAVATDERSAIRAVVGVAFALFVPGRSIVSNWPIMEDRSRFALAVLFSLAVLTLVSTVSLWLGYWHPLGSVEVECIVATVALVLGILRRRRAARAGDGTASEPASNG